MWRGLYTAGAGMMTEMERTAVISNNLANADTSGYKRDVAINKEFEPMLIRRINDFDQKEDITYFKGFQAGPPRPPKLGTLGLGSFTEEIAVDHEQGAMETTGNPMDIAIAGEGYFAVQTPQGVRYTRDGAFFKSSDGTLQNVKGQPVLNPQGRPIRIPQDATQIIFAPAGEIFVGNPQDEGMQQVGQLQLVQFDDPKAVLKQGDNLFYPQEGAEPQPATGEVVQGVLERSNANVVTEMVELITNHRVYEAGAKAITTQDTMLEASVTQVGRLNG